MKKLDCILLIDDNMNDNNIHSMTIKEADVTQQVKVVRDGEKGVEYLEKSEDNPLQYPYPNLILLDINMPGVDGFEFLKTAKEKALINPGKPVIVVMSNSLNPSNEEIAKEQHVSDIHAFTRKPLTKIALTEILEKFF